MRVSTAHEDGWSDAALELEGGTMRLRAGTHTYTVPLVTFMNGERNGIATLASLASVATRDSVMLRACGNCVHFRFSGLSFQFSGGMAGYCTLAGGRGAAAVIGIAFGCGEHATVPGWPDDPAEMERARREQQQRNPRPSRRPAFEGALLGLAVGHARSVAVFASDVGGTKGERSRASAPKINSPRSGVRAHSDDTELSVAVAESLIAARPAGGPGLTNEIVPHSSIFVGSSERRERDGKGCLSALYGIPVGLFFWRSPARAMEAARQSWGAGPDHAETEAVAAVVLIVALALRKRPPEEMYREVMEHCASRSRRLREWWQRIPALIGSGPEVALSALGSGPRRSLEGAVTSALWCFWRSPEDYSRTVLAAGSSQRDSARIACLAGGVSGAFNGLDAIPESWRAALSNSATLLDVAQRLWEAAP